MWASINHMTFAVGQKILEVQPRVFFACLLVYFPDLDTYYFTALGHWELSHTITTNHLLSVVSITNTLVSVSNASFIPERERKRKLIRQVRITKIDSGLSTGVQSSIKGSNPWVHVFYFLWMTMV